MAMLNCRSEEIACFLGRLGWLEYTFHGYVFWLMFGINFRAKMCEGEGKKWEKNFYNTIFKDTVSLGRK